MRNVWKAMAFGIAALALSACAGMEYDKAKMASPTGDAFSKALHKNYVAKAAEEYKDGDYSNADIFSVRALAAASGKPTAPEAVAARDLPESAKADLTAARQQLVAALDAGAAAKWPDVAALAQVQYECWMEEQEENRQPEDIRICRSGFENAMVQLRANMMPAAAAPAPAPAPAPAAAAPKGPTVPGPFTLYFGHNSNQLDADAKRVVAQAVAAFRSAKPSTLAVSGYADTSGNPAYNADLSQRRAKAVAAALIAAGVPRNQVGVVFFGENRQARKTDDDVKSVENRRVLIELKP